MAQKGRGERHFHLLSARFCKQHLLALRRRTPAKGSEASAQKNDVVETPHLKGNGFGSCPREYLAPNAFL
jgi:hypothetical protein